MATIIDSLIVQLGLDSKDVETKAPGVQKKLADLEKSASKTESGVKNIGKASKDTSSDLTALTGKLTSFLAVLGGTAAVSAFIKDTVETNTQLYFLSKNLEMSTQKITAWGAAAQEIGGNKGSIQGLMRDLAAMAGQLAAGQTPKLMPLMARFGINFHDDPDKMMMKLAERFQGMDRKLAFSFGMASGLTDDQMNLILQGPAALKSAIGRTKGFGATDKEAASAAQLKLRFTDLELQFSKIGYDLLYKITPYLNKFLDLLLKIGAWAQRHEKIVAIIAGIAAALTAVAATAMAVGAAVTAWTAFLGVIEAIGAVLGAISVPVLIVVAVIAALAAGFILLYDDYKTWSEGGKSFFDWTAWTKLIKSAGDGWNTLSDKIKSATASLADWIAKTAIQLGVDPALTTAEGQAKAEAKAYEAYNKAHPNNQLTPPNAANDDTADKIAHLEGFYNKHEAGKKGNIPQEAHNPGDITYGDFAIAHGANGYKIAEGGKKIATFPDDQTGFAAMHALLATDKYKNLSPDKQIKLWQTGSLLDGVKNATNVPAVASASAQNSTSSTDNSRVTNIGTINLNNPSGTNAMTPSLARGMDWNTILTQQNSGLLP